jgi:hypothetical protein
MLKPEGAGQFGMLQTARIRHVWWIGEGVCVRDHGVSLERIETVPRRHRQIAASDFSFSYPACTNPIAHTRASARPTKAVLFEGEGLLWPGPDCSRSARA